MEGKAAQAQGRGQGLTARLAASSASVLSDKSSGPSSPATPPDERHKGRSDVFSRLGPMAAPTSQAFSDQVGSQHLLGQHLLGQQLLQNSIIVTELAARLLPYRY